MKNLKRIFIACVLVGLSMGANAQLTYGIKAGFNASTVTGFKDLTDDDMDVTYRPGFHVGVAAQYMFAPQMGIETGLYYSTLGVNSKTEENGNKFEMSFSPSYLQLPIAFIYKIGVGQDLSFYPSLGLYMGYGIGGKFKSEISGQDVPEGIKDMLNFEYDFFGDNVKTNRFDLGATVGLNLQYSNYTIGLGYDYGFMNINSEDVKDDETGKKLDDWKNGNIKVSVGYFF